MDNECGDVDPLFGLIERDLRNGEAAEALLKLMALRAMAEERDQAVPHEGPFGDGLA